MMPADSIAAAATKQDFGTSRWQLSNKTTPGCGCTQKGRDVSSWHEAAVRRVQNYVRFLGYSGREMLAVRLSHFDPEPTRATDLN